MAETQTLIYLSEMYSESGDLCDRVPEIGSGLNFLTTKSMSFLIKES